MIAELKKALQLKEDNTQASTGKANGMAASSSSSSTTTTTATEANFTTTEQKLSNGSSDNSNNNNNSNQNQLPAWLDNITLEKAIRENLGDYKKIQTLSVEDDAKPGENYSSLMLRVNVEVELKDDSLKSTAFVLKTQVTNEVMANILNRLQFFTKEEQTYQYIIPKFEKLYQDVGKTVKFAPSSYKFDRDVGVDYVLLEDLRLRNYKNANRVAGFDMMHMKEVLTKLAEFHAASACYAEHFGMYGEEFTVGVFNETNRALFKQFNDSSAFLSELKKWKNGQYYYGKLADSDQYLLDRLLTAQKYNPSEFNVLNHGDCWSNNIMFQYDAFGNIKNTLFIDFQLAKYGSPVHDLYYLILSSAAIDIKLTQFEYFIRFYYDKLVENLKLLQYHRPLPKLKSLYCALYNNGLKAYNVVSKALPVVMVEKINIVNLENYIHDESKMKTAMYTNHKYVQAMSEILPWLDNRGLLDWK